MSNKPPSIKAAHIVGPLRVSIAWTTGELIEVDLSSQTVAPFDALLVAQKSPPPLQHIEFLGNR
ncbi:MAG: hypothetical protein ACOYNF_18845 [Rhodoferax sp.]